MPDPNVDVAAATAAYELRAPTQEGDQGWSRDPVSGRFVQTPAEPAPVADANAATTEPPAATEPPAPEPDRTDEAPDFTHISDEALSPELLQMKRSMQADYTRKTQEVAPWRKLGSEFGVEQPEELREALAVYQRLQDPRNWPGITQELTDYMTQMGMSPTQARQAAHDQLADLATPAAADDGEYSEDFGDADPAIASLASQVQKLTALYEQDRQQRQQQEAQSAQETQLEALAEGLSRMEDSVRQQNPSYNDEDIEIIYNLMGPDGNLFAAQAKYESMIGRRVQGFIKGKQAVAATQPSPVPGGGVIPAAPDGAPKTLDEAYRKSMEYFAQLEQDS